jgi:DNA polymerase/3'-5' exonuclease PolX
MQLAQARAIAEALRELLRPACTRVEIAGSIRRRRPDVGDIELLCIPKYGGPVDLLDSLLRRLIAEGALDYRRNKRGSTVYGPKNKLLVHNPSGIGVDVFCTTWECWGVSLVVRTGGKTTNKEIATRALQRGMKFHAYGRGFTRADNTELVCHTEREVFKAVGLRCPEPWERK